MKYVSLPYKNAEDARLDYSQEVSESNSKLLRTVKKLGVDQSAMSIVEAIKGLDRPVASANCACSPLKEYCAIRTVHALKTFFAERPDIDAEMRWLSPDAIQISGEHSHNTVAIRRVVNRQIKPLYDTALTRLLPTLDGKRIGAVTFGMKATSRKMRRQLPSSVSSTELKSNVVPISGNPVSLACVAFELWRPAFDIGQEEASPLDKAEMHAAHIERLAVDALMNPASTLFAHGDLRCVERSLLKELTARAGSFDLGGVAPVQPQGIPSFLATLPIDKEGTRLILPSVKNK